MGEQLTIGELCAGYNGLGKAVERVFNARVAWFSEYEEAPSRILAYRYPGVRNLGDMTRINWGQVEPVHILSGGTPCQDMSAAGRRRGMTEGTRSNLFIQMCEAIDVIKPRYVVWENVRGAFSATADSGMEQCERCVGGAGDGEPVLRALGRVLGNLSDLGYDAEWRGLRASDVGAPHARFRVFILATHRDGGRGGWGPVDTGAGEGERADATAWGTDTGASAPEDADRAVGGQRRITASGETARGGARADAGGSDRADTPDAVELLGTPRCSQGMVNELRPPDLIGNPRGRVEEQIGLLPTPTSAMALGGNVSRSGARSNEVLLPGVAKLFPKPRAGDGEKGGPNQHGSSGDLMMPSAVTLLPTPQANLGEHGRANGQPPEQRVRKQISLADIVVKGGMDLLPTCTVQDGANTGGPSQFERNTLPLNTEVLILPHLDPVGPVQEYENLWYSLTDRSPYWRTEEREGVKSVDYWPAIQRWEQIMGYASPPPSIPDGRGGKFRLNPAFTEWMMGQEPGWITDPAIGIKRNDQLKACGNGVVTQQAVAALEDML